MGKWIVSVFIFAIFSSVYAAEEPAATEAHQALQKTLSDYIGLYRADTLDQWVKLFDPEVRIFFPGDEGTITVRNLEEFLKRQKNYFATRKSISERLENVQIFEGKRIARIVADFVFLDEGQEKPGKLGLHLVQSKEGWKIVSVLFSYDS
jgi:hypothetical protein